MADPHQKPLPAQGFSALMAGTLRGDPAQSWINFKSKKAGGWGGGGRGGSEITSRAVQDEFLALVTQD